MLLRLFLLHFDADEDETSEQVLIEKIATKEAESNAVRGALAQQHELVEELALQMADLEDRLAASIGDGQRLAEEAAKVSTKKKKKKKKEEIELGLVFLVSFFLLFFLFRVVLQF